MPDPQPLFQAQDTWSAMGFQGLLGFMGACVRVAIGHDRGEPQSWAKIMATVVTGTVLAGTCSQGLTTYFDVPPAFSGGAGFIVGLMGIGAVYQYLDWRAKFNAKS